MSAPVAATRYGPSTASWIAGNPNTATRAPHANDTAAVTARQTPSATTAASGESAKAPPAKVITALPPRKPAKTGKQWPTIAPATPA
jgi:hypothetical protein